MKIFKTANYEKIAEFENKDTLRNMESQIYSDILKNIKTFNLLGDGFLEIIKKEDEWYDLFFTDNTKAQNKKIIGSGSIIEIGEIVEEILGKKMRGEV